MRKKMFPIILDISALNIVLIGEGDATERRLKSLEDAGATDLHIFKETPPLYELEDAHVIFAGDLTERQAEELANKIKGLRVLLNVEDNSKYCDFHVPAMVRSGDLLITTSTGGKSPRLAKRIKEQLEENFGDEWGDRLEEIAEQRVKWKNEGLGIAELSKKTDELLKERGWL